MVGSRIWDPYIVCNFPLLSQPHIPTFYKALPKRTPGKTSTDLIFQLGEQNITIPYLSCKEKHENFGYCDARQHLLDPSVWYQRENLRLMEGNPQSDSEHSEVQLSLDFSKWQRKKMETVRLFCLLTKWCRVSPGWLSAFDSCVEGRAILLCELRHLESLCTEHSHCPLNIFLCPPKTSAQFLNMCQP